jgi:hypothetical protein
MAAGLNVNQKRFIKYRVGGLSRADAYMKAYGNKNKDSARRRASDLVRTNQDVRKEINRRLDESTEEAQETFALEMSEAAATIAEIRESGTKEDAVRLRAAEYIVDRGMGKPRTDVNLEGEIKGDITLITAITRPEGWKDGD